MTHVIDELYYGAVGRFLKLEPIRKLLSQELYFERLSPFVETPDLVDGQKPLIEHWGTAQPSLFRWCTEQTHCDLQNSGFHPSRQAVFQDRVSLRLAAYRLFDEWMSGSPAIYLKRPFTRAGEMFVPVRLSGDDGILRVGENKIPEYNTSPGHLVEFKAKIGQGVLEQIETVLFPLAGVRGRTDAEHWAKIWTRWEEVAPLRETWLETGLHPFPQVLDVHMPGNHWTLRLEPTFAADIDPMALADAGLSAYWLKSTSAYVSARQSEFPELASDGHIREWIEKIFLTRGCVENQI